MATEAADLAARQRERDRKASLQREIERYVGRGYRVVSQSDYAAQLVKPKHFSLKWLLLWMLSTFWTGTILGILIYAFWYWSRKDQQLYLTIDDGGRIHKKG